MYSGDSPSNGSPTSMKSFLETCSWGKVSFPTNPSKNTIYDGVVSITSDAICSRPQKACDFQAEAAAEAERILAKQGVDIYNYMHRIFLIPTEQPGCELQGVASQVRPRVQSFHGPLKTCASHLQAPCFSSCPQLPGLLVAHQPFPQPNPYPRRAASASWVTLPAAVWWSAWRRTGCPPWVP